MSDEAKLDGIAQKADFVQCSLDFKKKIPVASGCLNSTGNPLCGVAEATFWIDRISWAYQYLSMGHPKAKVTTLQPITIVIAQTNVLGVINSAPIFNGQHAAQYVPADHYLHRSVDIDIINPNVANFHQLEVNLKLDGTLVLPRPGVSAPSFNEQFYYLENRTWKDASTDASAELPVCQCSLKIIMSAGCQCGGA